MKNIQRIHLFEYLLYAAILLVALCGPFFNGVFEYKGWNEFLNISVRVLPFLLIFLINNYILVPRLLFAEKYRNYFLFCILSVIAAVYLSGLLFSAYPPFDRMPPPGSPYSQERTSSPANPFPKGYRPPPDTPYAQERTSPPANPFPKGYRPPSDTPYARERTSSPANPFSKGNRSPSDTFPPSRKDLLPPGAVFPPMRHHPFFHFGQAIVAFLLIGFNSGVKSFVRWSEERVRQADRESQYLQTELAFLKHQISPHFFMNTLNNIHSLIDIDTEKARDAVVKLSRLMRYMLYESDVQKVSLKKEIEFIESYIELMRMRYDEDKLTIETAYPAVTEEIFVPSFLFLSFIENAFKHGVGIHAKSLIRIRFASENGRLAFVVDNNKSGLAPAISETSGIGLENVRKRLDLIYKDDYALVIRSDGDTYEINLNIPV
jgi:two-component sensor histidine kinase